MTLNMKLDESKQEGIAIGIHTKALETARNLFALKMLTDEQIAQSTGLSLQQIQELRANATH